MVLTSIKYTLHVSQSFLCERANGTIRLLLVAFLVIKLRDKLSGLRQQDRICFRTHIFSVRTLISEDLVVR